MSGSTKPPRVLISYSHDPARHADSVLELANRLRQDGVDAWLDRFEPYPEMGWLRWMQQEIERADFVVLVCTETYRRRFEGQDDDAQGRGISWEGQLLGQEIYQARGVNRRIVPALLDGEASSAIPRILQAYACYRVPSDYESLYRRLTGQPEVVAAPIGRVRTLEPITPQSDGIPADIAHSPQPTRPRRQCPECSGLVQEEARFCSLCGCPLQCPRCDAVLEPGRRFCSVCRCDPREQIAAREQSWQSAGTWRDPSMGTTLNDRYLIEEEIGGGRFSVVYRASDGRTGRNVALKLLHDDLLGDVDVAHRLQQEGKILCQLRDPHTVTVHDLGRDRYGRLYIVMEFLEGRTLSDELYRKKWIDWRRALGMLSQICSSLSEAHGLGIVHRGLEPGNIFLVERAGNREFIKVIDFGTSKLPSEHGDFTTQGRIVGTIEYASPEQLTRESCDGRSDIYSAGVVTYEMLAGQRPYPGAHGVGLLYSAMRRVVPKPPSVVNPRGNIPPAADQLVLEMLAVDPHARRQSASEVRAACLEILSSA